MGIPVSCGARVHTLVNCTNVASLLLENTLDFLKRLCQALHLGLIEGFGIVGTLRYKLAPGDLAAVGGVKGQARNLLHQIPRPDIDHDLVGLWYFAADIE